MATEKIQLTLSGKYDASQMFSKWQGDVSRFQKSHKDMSAAARSSLSEIAGMFSGELNGKIKTTISLLGEMSRGGIWGVMSAVANLAISKIVDRIRISAGFGSRPPRAPPQSPA